MQPAMARRLMRWQDGQHPAPWELMVCPTHRCNLKCGICARSWEGDEDPVLRHELSDERWLQLLDEAAEMGVRYFNIGGGGEPTLRIELVMEMCARAKRYGMEGHLQTNGTTFRETDLERLIELKWDALTISLDGPTAEINDAIRFKGAYIKSVKSIQLLSALKKKRRAVLPVIQINMVITALNFDRLEEMVTFCVDNGVNLLSVKSLLEYSPEMKAYILTPEQNAALPGYLDRAIIKADACGLSHNLESLLPAANAAEQGSAGNDRIAGYLATVPCLEPWRGLVVSSSGHVAPCCFFWDGAADTVRDTSLREVWHGRYMEAFREQMRAGVWPDNCRGCGFPDSSIHQQLRVCLAQAARANPGVLRAFLGMAAKGWNSLRSRGVRASLGRYRQWRAIQRALRKEE